jgi:hypothetical protein
LPPPNQAVDANSDHTPSPPWPARSGRRGVKRSLKEMTEALLMRSVEEGVSELRPPEHRATPPELVPLWIWPKLELLLLI